MANDNKTQASSEGLMETLLLPFSPRFIVLTICAVVTALLIGIGHRRSQDLRHPADPDPDLRRAHAARHPRSPAEEPRGSAQLPDLGAYALPARRDPPGDAAVFLREREGRHAVLAATPARWSISAPRWSSTSGRSAPRRTSTARAMSGCTIRSRRRRMPTEKFRVTIGGPDCAKPYSASVFNISAMSFGALSPNAVRALNAGAKKGGFAHDTGEGGFSPYHREMGGDIIWEIGSGYFGCRHLDGTLRSGSVRPRREPTTRSRWSSSRSARAPSPAMAACCRRRKSRRRSRRSAASRWARTASRRPRTAPSRRRSG